MATKGQIIENKITGEKVTFLDTAKDTSGKFLRFELCVKPRGFVAVNHIHPTQDEEFLMKKGVLKLLSGKSTHYLSPGQKLTVPKKVSHQWWNETDEEISLEITFTPAGNTEVFLEQFFGLCNDGKCGEKASPHFMQVMAFANKYQMYIQGPPVPLQKVLSAVLSPIARLGGYKKFYKKYSVSRP